MALAPTTTMLEDEVIDDPPDFVTIMLEEAIGQDEDFFLVNGDSFETGQKGCSPEGHQVLLEGEYELTRSSASIATNSSFCGGSTLGVSFKVPRRSSTVDNISLASNTSEPSSPSLSWSGWATEGQTTNEESEEHARARLEMFRDPSCQIQRHAVDPALSKLIKRGFDKSLRPSIWLALTGANALRTEGQYCQLLEYADSMLPILETQSEPQYTAHKRDLRQINLDITRTLCREPEFGPDGQGRRQLKRILSAYAWRNQEIGYCQGLNVIAAILLLELGNEEDTYWALVGLVENILPQRYFTRDMSGVSEDVRRFQGYVEALMPTVYNHFSLLGIDIAVVSLGWFLTLYAECVDRVTLYRLWDRLLLDGSDFMHGIGVGLIRTYRTQILATKELSELLIVLQDMSEGSKTSSSKFLRNVSKMEIRLDKIRSKKKR